MTCKEVVDFLMDYLAGELGCEERALFEKHLSLCPPCVEFLRAYRLTISLEKAAARECPETLERVPEALVRAILAARAGIEPQSGSPPAEPAVGKEEGAASP